MEFNAEFFGGNRRRLMEVTGAELIVLTGNGLLQRNADITFPYRQNQSGNDNNTQAAVIGNSAIQKKQRQSKALGRRQTSGPGTGGQVVSYPLIVC